LRLIPNQAREEGEEVKTETMEKGYFSWMIVRE